MDTLYSYSLVKIALIYKYVTIFNVKEGKNRLINLFLCLSKKYYC